MTEKIIGIIQARMGSSRLPGKMLEDLGGRSVLSWILERVIASQKIDEIILATTQAPEDQALCDIAETFGVRTYCGPNEDVLKRFVLALDQSEGDIVVRICADNPLISPQEIDRVIQEYQNQRPDYAFNHIPKMGNDYPDGLGAEVFSKELLLMMDQSCSLPKHREHVTAYLWDNKDDYKFLTIPCPEDLQSKHKIKLDIDTVSDLALMRRLVENLSPKSTSAEIVKAWEKLHG